MHTLIYRVNYLTLAFDRESSLREMKLAKTFIASTLIATAAASLCVSTASAIQLAASTRLGIGAIPYNVGLSTKGVTFRVWAPNAQAVSVAGSWNFYSNTSHQLANEGNGFCDVLLSMSECNTNSR